MRDVGPAGLVGRLAARCPREPEDADSGGVHHPLAARGPGRIEDVERAADVDVVEDPRVGGPEAVDRRQVEHETGALERGPDAARVPDVHYGPLRVDAAQVAV